MFCLQSTQVLYDIVFMFGLKYYTKDHGIYEDRLTLKHFVLRHLSRLLKGFLLED